MLVPVTLALLLSLSLLLTKINTDELRQGDLVGQAIALQLANSVPEYLLADDSLSLTVILDRLVTDGVFNTAVIYGADDRLLASAGGVPWVNDSQYMAEIHYQNSVAGFVRISLPHNRLFGSQWLVIGLLVLGHLLIWVLSSTLLSRVMLAESVSRSESKGEAAVRSGLRFAGIPIVSAPARPDKKSKDPDLEQYSILVLKTGPARLMRQIETRLKKAIVLHQGRTDAFDAEEIVVYFNQREDHGFHAICTALLMKMIVGGLKNSTFKCAIQSGKGGSHFRDVRKQASYYSSLVDNGVIVSQQIFQTPRFSARMISSAFFSSRAPDAQLYRIEQLTDAHRSLVESQFRQL